MSRISTSQISKQAILHTAAFAVALCSFAYELVYSELLTVMYGGALTQYGLTIGLFFSSLGIGSYLSKHLDDGRNANFFRTEVYLAFAAPAGLLFIIWINTVEFPAVVPSMALQVAARLPVVLVGILSGFELPLLLSMVKAEHGTDPDPGGWRVKVAEIVNSIAYRVTGLFFHTSKSSDEYDTYSTVLAMDYLGGLGGALIYVYYLYPEFGLISSVFLLALLNCVAALLFALRFSVRPWGIFAEEKRNILTEERVSFLVACLLLTSVFTGVAVNHQTVNNEVTEYYMEDVIESNWANDVVEADITDQQTTKHQQIVKYERSWAGDSKNMQFAGDSDTCMRLDTAIQVCDSWTDSYHSGLVDVPMTMYPNSTETDVLLVGGGDYIADKHLRNHRVDVDQVDIDGEFLEYAKDDPFLSQYHDDAYEYENLSVHQQDIYAYLQENDKQYDVILLDLPGAKSRKMLGLYSVEFYSMLTNHLSDDGTVVTWGYSKYAYGEHYKAYMNTVSEAGFEYKMSYWARDDFNQDGDPQLGERFHVLATDDNRPIISPQNGTTYVQTYGDHYEDREWRKTPTYTNVETNRVFHPNYDIIVDTRAVSIDSGNTSITNEA
ncbi:spermidine synthase [Haladaptatus cibarius]|uniref:spermidine synthase n=1 Tax=Haladaptatus cibarius TaxID=453847 RepID=UPI001B808783|nr:spermidine synthase [Haladaptatus cibarius]